MGRGDEELVDCFYHVWDKEIGKYQSKAHYFESKFGKKAHYKRNNLSRSRQKGDLPSRAILQVILSDWENKELAESFWLLKTKGVETEVLIAHLEKLKELTPQERRRQRLRRKILRERPVWGTN